MAISEDNTNIEIKNGILTKIHKANEILEVPKGVHTIATYDGHNLPVKKIILPDGLQTIQGFAFYQSQALEEVSLPNSVTSIGQRAFADCKMLKKISQPVGLTKLEPGVFANCESLEEIIFPKGIKKIPYRACANCRKLKRVVIPEGIEEIDWAAFAGCTSLEEIVLPQSLKKLNKQVFMNCKNLMNVQLSNDITVLPDQLFQGCKKLVFHLNPNIKELGDSTFEGCSRLTIYPSHVTKIGENCFKNCTGLQAVELNENIEFLPDGAFEGCVHLNTITTQRKESLPIRKRCFRNCRSLTSIPSFVQNYDIQSFENCTSLTSVDPVQDYIPMACFRGCQNIKEVSNSNKIRKFGSFAFSGCQSLEEMEINTQAIAANAFSHCKNLKKVALFPGMRSIGTEAFFDCPQLTDVLFPDTIESIKKSAFQYCHSIKSFTVPCNLTCLGEGAFSYMDSLEYIGVSPENKNFQTPDHKILIRPLNQKLILYASGCKDKAYSLEDYNIQLDALGVTTIRPISGIDVYAFAGAKNLEELTICACTDNIESSAFMGCTNLKTLTIKAIDCFTCSSIRIREHGEYYYEKDAKIPLYLPFETVNFTGNIVMIYPNALQYFSHVKEINLAPNGAYKIETGAFFDCTEVVSVQIPDNVKEINENAFSQNTTLIFENGLQVTGLSSMQVHNEYGDNCLLYSLYDGTYHIQQNQRISTIHRSFIDSSCSFSEEINHDPLIFFDYTNDLIDHNLLCKELLNGILIKNISLEGRKILLENLKPGDQFFLDVLTKSTLLDKKDDCIDLLLSENHFSTVVDFINLLKEYNVQEPLLYNKYFMAYCSIDSFKFLLQERYVDFVNVLQKSHLLEFNDDLKDTIVYILSHNNLNWVIKYIKEYKHLNESLMNPLIISIADHPLAEAFFRVYDANIKRLVKASMIFDNPQSGRQNLIDLLFLLKITGALEDDPIIKQRASTFITEKMFAEKLPNGEKNMARIVGDDIHRVFNFPQIHPDFDPEFTQFFLENFCDLIEQEKLRSGTIQRIYLNFKEIAKTCTSDRGEQRRLKVTLQKALLYLDSNKFDGVTQENRELANSLGKWYDSNKCWLTALYIYQESLNAPRNIFTKIELDGDGVPIYDYDPSQDLREEINENYSYEWLPKQDYDNLILGKYCSCCAHVNGAGQGIMRSSMILDNCQNLVIRDSTGEIIAKSTIYVNREMGYGVCNNVEVSLNYREAVYKKKIYKAFLRGIQAFMETYNQNNSIPLSDISIGLSRNAIIEYLDDINYPSIPVHPTISYAQYSLDSNFAYNGDCHANQKLLLWGKNGCR